MERRRSYWLALIMLPMFTTAQSYFKDGMIWETQVFSTSEPTPQSVIETNFIDGTEPVDGYTALKMYGHDDNGASTSTLKGYIRTDGDKVYFKNATSNHNKWFLIYDFGLTEGKGCYIYNTYIQDNEHDPYKTYIKCTGITAGENNCPDIMQLEEYTDESCTICIAKGKWIKGVSSWSGVMYNNRFELDGIASYLIEARYNNDIVYKQNTTKINDTGDYGNGVSIEGKTVTLPISGRATVADVFGIDGRHINSVRTAPLEKASVIMPHSGIYIVRVGDKTHKIAVK